MINGLAMSGMAQMNLTFKSHYRNLDQIINGSRSRFDVHELSFHDIQGRKKHFHDRWKRFKTQEKQSFITRQNQRHHQRIQSIMDHRSPYRPPFTPKDTFKSSKAHEFYRRRKMEVSIERENPEIARRIIRVRGSLDLGKNETSFEKSRREVRRLEKYPLVRRMMEYSSKKLGEEGSCRIKTESTPATASKKGWREYRLS